MSSAPPAPTRTGEPIPGYSLRERVGAGGYGEVWAVEAPGGLTKAIKFVYGHMDESRAAREFKSLSLIKGVRHPFLLSLERIEVVDGQLLIVSELADESLKDRFEKAVKNGQAGLPRNELLEHLRDAADALDYMNSQHGLQHLDVKPENLLFVGGRIKVADFGLVKDIQESAGSLMGGLTPIYAPPEVFDARPSRRSDQYSLAIVYQEMLTGFLPFPGRTTAQLAAQHLTAKPRLNTLPAADQPVIEKALSKDPEHRFSSCREMVEALLRARAEDPPYSSNAKYEAGSPGIRATAILDGSSPPVTAASATSATGSPEQEMLARAESAEQATIHDAQGQYEAAEQAAEMAVPPSIVFMPPAASLCDLPPLEIDLSGPRCRPTLLVGIGGLAGKTLQHLRRKLSDSCAPEEREKFHFLVVDTDSKELMETTHGDKGSAFLSEETLALPIRKSNDYRNDSRKFLDWLSRRWLFNIPRSQQTEGIRPFGRLAFVDHGETVMKTLRAAVSKLSAAAEDASAEARVIVVGSASGGTAGGMVLDLIFTVRQIMDEQKVSGGVDLLLLHGTGRQPAAQELATVNSFSLLTELNQVLQPGGVYPGEVSCGVKARSAKEPAVRSAYLVHLGEDLGAEQFLAACKNVAAYLLIDLATPAGTYLDACRSGEPKEGGQGVMLRSFGIGQIGFSEAVVARGMESLCHAVVQRWHGEPKVQPVVSLSARVADLPPAAPVSAPNSKDVELEALAMGQAKALGLDLDSLVQRLYLLSADELGGHPDIVFERIVKECPVRPRTPPPVEKWFAGSARFFGARGSDLESGVQSPLQTALMKRIPEVFASQGEHLREWLLALTEDPASRLYGAQWCARWFRTHFKNLVDKAGDACANIRGQLSNLEAKLAVVAKTPVKSAAKDAGSTAEQVFLQHCQLRMYQLAAHAAQQFAQSLMSYVSQANDLLLDFGREVKHMAGQFVGTEQRFKAGSDAAALAQLRLEEDYSANLIDRHIQDTVFSTTGFRTTLQGGTLRHELLGLLRQLARQSVFESLARVDLMTMVRELGKPDGKGASQLGAIVAGAQPWLQQVGGDRRLVCVFGQTSGEPTISPAGVSSLIGSAYFEQQPIVIPAAAREIVFCFELGNVPLPHAAAKLIDHRPDLAQAASRLHPRSDVAWLELPV